MSQVERLIIEALSEYISPAAAQNLLNRALRRTDKHPGAMSPRDWAAFVSGPLLEELRKILPVRTPSKKFLSLLQNLESSASEQKGTPQGPEKTGRGEAVKTIEMPHWQVDLQDERAREQLARDLAREDGVSGVLLRGDGFSEARLPGAEELAPILAVVDNLLRKGKSYKIFYSVFQEGQVLIRPFGSALVAIVTKRGANLGRLLHVLNSFEAKGGQV